MAAGSNDYKWLPQVPFTTVRELQAREAASGRRPAWPQPDETDPAEPYGDGEWDREDEHGEPEEEAGPYDDGECGREDGAGEKRQDRVVEGPPPAVPSLFGTGPGRIAEVGPPPPRRIARPEERDLRASEQFVVVPVDIVKRTGGGYPAIVLGRVMYWFGTGANGRLRLAGAGSGEAPNRWAPGYHNLEIQTGLPKDKARRALQNLEKGGLITIHRGGGESGCSRDGRACRRLQIELCEELRQKAVAPREWGVRSTTVRVDTSLVAVTKSGNEALVLGAILPWFRPNESGRPSTRIQKNGRRWRANSYELLSSETGLSESQVKRAIQGLRTSQLIVTDQWLFQGKRTLHVSVNQDRLKAEWLRAHERQEQGRRPRQAEQE